MKSDFKDHDEFTISGHRIEVEYKPLTGEAMGSIREAIRKDDFFGAEVRAIGGAVEHLVHDNKTIIRKRNRAERRSGASLGDADGIPNDYDSSTDEFLYDQLLKTIVANEPWLATRRPFRDAFEQYADKSTSSGATKKDPTPLRAATNSES